MSILYTLENCRICKSSNILDVIALGEQSITSRFPLYGDYSTPKTPITLCMCQQCGLIQLRQTTESKELYEYEYGYRSGISNTMKLHLKEYQQEILSIISLQEGDVIVDIGSNDSTMLQYYSPTIRRIGVDPTGKQFKDYYGDVELLPNYFTHDNFTNTFGNVTCKLVSSISMFYDLPDPVQFAKDIYSILDDNGIWTCEQSYLLSMINTNSIDTICHEHLEYYSLHQIKEIADRANFNIIDVKFNDCNGGSFRIYFAKKISAIYTENTELINDILNKEKEKGIMNIELYDSFMKGCDKQIQYLKDFIDIINSQGKKVYIYGASTKGNCLLQYANINESHIKYAVERNPNKIGKMTSTGIEIIGEDQMRENPPDYLLVLPWHFRDEIIKREDAFLQNGGQFIFPFPTFEIVGSKPKLLITGCDGMIAQHILYNNEIQKYNVYGFGHSDKSSSKNITKFNFDMNSDLLRHYTEIVKPDSIIHLAAISSSQIAFENPFDAIQTNGLITAKLCDIIHCNHWNTKLFNASSSEIYKGHIDYLITENDTHKYHNHPYSIAKILGHSIVDFYREHYGKLFSNGIIFTTESKLKKPIFLLNKIADYIKIWKSNNDTVPLQVGNLDSYRNILHASDVASAIFTILSQETANNYLICNNESDKVKDLVFSLFKSGGIEIEEKENCFYDKVQNKPILVINSDKYLGFDSTPTNIRGESVNLRNLGWSPKVSIDEIISEILER